LFPVSLRFPNLTNTKEGIPAEEGETRTTYLNFLLSQRNHNIYIYLSLPKLVTNPEGKKNKFLAQSARMSSRSDEIDPLWQLILFNFYVNCACNPPHACISR
jgi:hypothetical protein